MNMGTTIKFYATYDEPYWQEKGFSGEFLSNGGRKTVVTDSGISVEGGPVTWVMDGTCYSKRPMLVGFLSGNLAVEWSQVRSATIQSILCVTDWFQHSTRIFITLLFVQNRDQWPIYDHTFESYYRRFSS